MTIQDKLGLRWANTGGVTDPGDVKYTTGWIVEIPTFQNFNYVLQVLDSNILVHAESGEWFWEDTISYLPGAQVKGSDGIFYRCHTPSFEGSITGADPVADSLGNYWTKGQVFGVAGDDVTTVDGIKLKGIVPSNSVTWEGTDLTIENGAPMMAFNTTGATDNWLLGNISGELVVVKTGVITTSADGRAMGTAEPNTYKIFHEGNPPKQTDVANTIPANPNDGAIYARKNTTWVPVTTTTVSSSPPPPSIGAGQNWYNLSDGQSYTDIFDGDSSQWVPTMAPIIADGSDGADGLDGVDGIDGVDGAPGLNGADGINGINGVDGADGVGVPLGGAVDEVLTKNSAADGDSSWKPSSSAGGGVAAKNLIVNGDFQVWQRGTTYNTSATEYTADRLVSFASTEVNRILDVPSGFTYGLSAKRLFTDTGIFQPIELPSGGQPGVLTIGTQVTFSLWFRLPNNVPLQLQADWRPGLSSTGKISDLANTNIALGNGSWQKASKTWTIVTSPTATLRSYCPVVKAISGILLEVTGMQLELGGAATDFEFKHKAEELSVCERYFVKGLPVGGGGYATNVGQTAYAGSGVAYPTTMRTAPAITYVHENGSNSDGALTAVLQGVSGAVVGTGSLQAGAQWWRGRIDLNAEL